jgi:uncharacterized protein (DUF697 family)
MPCALVLWAFGNIVRNGASSTRLAIMLVATAIQAVMVAIALVIMGFTMGESVATMIVGVLSELAFVGLVVRRSPKPESH